MLGEGLRGARVVLLKVLIVLLLDAEGADGRVHPDPGDKLVLGGKVAADVARDVFHVSILPSFLLARKPFREFFLGHDDAVVLGHADPLREEAILVDAVQEILEGSHVTG